MEVIIPHDRFIKLIGNFIHEKFPNFSADKALEETWSNGDDSYIEYYDPENPRLVFAKYYIWKSELVLHRDLFAYLDRFFGDDITYTLDWFNNEFGQNAENITY